MNITWLPRKHLFKKTIKQIRTVNVVLDIGCGIMPQNFVIPRFHICCEPYDEYVSHLKNKIKLPENKDRDYLILKMGWQDISKYFPPKSVDSIFLIDVIEHLDKDVGKKLLLETQEIAKYQVIVFTPWGFMPQEHPSGKDSWGLDGVSWQEHKSGWLPEDFEGDGWKFFASEDFHITDNLGVKLKKPYGAFWAIKTNSDMKYFPLVKSKIIGGYKRILNKLRRKFRSFLLV